MTGGKQQGADNGGLVSRKNEIRKLEDQLADDERLMRDTARAYAQDKLMPRIIDAYDARDAAERR